ncbi:hypothetical protein NUW58_g4185 [Xylaria curta]|uniref:Uncharacterized protein n=1 Tax=Xylaria curta TaxID=42375 RepID=A0ACC1P7I4_9PEZI|nr:hypothetical protein NUW58_g4185 [Xylaria curta]
MNEDKEPQPGPIEGLPVELVRMILSALPDVVSLQAAALSCPLFYTAFLDAETSIATNVLLNQVDASVLPEAIAASESSWLRPHDTVPRRQTRKVITDFVAGNLCQRPTLPKSWLLKKALHIGRFHSCVEQLAEQFAEAALTKGPAARSQSSATYQERCRIQRALYREQKQLFFANFSPWENEQLGCIHDFLVRAISPAFNDVVEHDIAWGAYNVEFGDRIDAPYTQNVLSLGLKKLYQITRAETYDDRERVLCSGYSPRATYFFLYEGLRYANEQHDDFWLDDLTPENELLYVKQPFFADPDSGPADVWRWAHYEESWQTWVYQANRDNLRRWGYVMWDRSRLEAIGVFQEPWEETDEGNSEESVLEQQEAQRQREYLKSSWEQRQRILSRGGTGWWSWGDESKVRWRGEKPDTSTQVPRAGPASTKYIEPHSLQEAREMLTILAKKLQQKDIVACERMSQASTPPSPTFTADDKPEPCRADPIMHAARFEANPGTGREKNDQTGAAQCPVSEAHVPGDTQGTMARHLPTPAKRMNGGSHGDATLHPFRLRVLRCQHLAARAT